MSSSHHSRNSSKVIFDWGETRGGESAIFTTIATFFQIRSGVIIARTRAPIKHSKNLLLTFSIRSVILCHVIYKTLTKLIFALIAFLMTITTILFLLAPPTTFAHPPYIDATQVPDDFRNPKFLKDPCPADPKNLLQNAAMDPGRDTQYGSVVDAWEPFIFNGAAPQFRWVNNEGIYRGQSQQIFSTNTFDAGIYQVIHNTTPGSYYWFRLGWAPAAKYTGGGNDGSSNVGVRVGVDPFGGTDPKAASVAWGPGLFGDNKALNRIQLTLFFPASASNVTIFMRAIATDGSSGENRVWFNAPCMEARPDIPPATPLPPTSTSTPTPTATRPAPSRPPATKAPTTIPSVTPTRIIEDIRAPYTATPTIVTTISQALPSATPRFARPDVEAAPGLPFDLGTGAMAGLGVVFSLSGFLFLGLGFISWQRIH